MYLWRDSNDDKSDRHDDDSDGDRRGSFLTTVLLTITFCRKLLSGFFHGNGYLPAKDDVAGDEKHTRKDRVDEQVCYDPDTHKKCLVVCRTEGTHPTCPVPRLHQIKPVQRVGVKQAAHGGNDDDGDDTFVTCTDDVDAVGPDDGGGSLGGESHKDPGRQSGCSVHHPDEQFADDYVTGSDVVIQNLQCPYGQSPGVQRGGVGQGQGGQVNVHG